MDLRPLRAAGFRHLAVAYWVNEFGTWIGEIALTILVYNRTGSAVGTAALFVGLRSFPAVLAPLLTTRIETIRPRLTLSTLYVLEAVIYGGIAVLTRHFSLPAVLVLGALDGSLAVVAKALTRSATAASLAPDGLLREGNAILNLGVMAATACSPLVAGALIAFKGAGPALLVDSATFLVTAAIISSARGIRLDTDRGASWSRRVRNGLEVVRTRRTVRGLMIAIALIFLLCAIPAPVDVVFVKHVLHGGDAGYGLMLGSWGLGMVIGAAGFAAFGQVRLINVIAIGTSLIAVGYAGTAASPTLAIACTASVVGGVGNGAGWIAAVTAVQERIPMETQSAISSLIETLNQVMPAVGFAVGGALAVATSARIAYATAAAGVALIALLALTSIDRVQLQELSDMAHPAPDTPRSLQETPPPEQTFSLIREAIR
jgi:hypothetical protein